MGESASLAGLFLAAAAALAPVSAVFFVLISARAAVTAGFNLLRCKSRAVTDLRLPALRAAVACLPSVEYCSSNAACFFCTAAASVLRRLSSA
ncbi:hypothetical protein D3C79_889760 [compost metagenome]